MPVVMATLSPYVLMATSDIDHCFFPHSSPLQQPKHAHRRPKSAQRCLCSPFPDSPSTVTADPVDGGGVSPLNTRVKVSVSIFFLFH
jgi:hypothetical protein